jgi:hypothetical protein
MSENMCRSIHHTYPWKKIARYFGVNSVLYSGNPDFNPNLYAPGPIKIANNKKKSPYIYLRQVRALRFASFYIIICKQYKKMKLLYNEHEHLFSQQATF